MVATTQVAGAIIAEAALSFLGLGLPITQPSLGTLIRSGYDLIFAGYWLSHVPSGRFDAFWSMLRGALAPDGRVVMVDDGVVAADGAECFADDPTGKADHRRLSDGREFTIVKLAYEPRRLEARLADLGWLATVTLRNPSTYVVDATPN